MARLVIPDEPTFATFTGVTSQAAFNVTFALFDKASLRVQVNGADLGQSDFTLTGTLLEGGGYQGGTVTLNTAATGDVLIWRDTLAVRTSQFAPSASVPVRTIDQAFNRDAAIQQELQRDVGRAVAVPIGEVGAELPKAIQRAGRAFAFDGLGRPLMLSFREAGNPGIDFGIWDFGAWQPELSDLTDMGSWGDH